MRYAPLLAIRLTHAYYGDGRCPDFTVVPADATARQLNNHRCVLRPRMDGLDVLAPIDPGAAQATPFIPFAPGTAFSFELRLNNPEFPLYTDYAALPGDYGFRLNPATKASNRAFATVDIERNFNRIDAPTTKIAIAFKSKQLRWAYYLVINRSNADQVAIIDGREDAVKMSWERSDQPPSDRIAEMLAAQYRDGAILRFLSREAVPCLEAGAKNIQLWLGGNKIVEHLPSPSYRNFFQTNAGTEKNAADAIFEIVTCLTNNTLIKG